MAYLFLSHSSADRASAETLLAWLRGLGHDGVFLDVDPKGGLVAGQPWETRLYTELSRCRALVVLVTNAWLESPWCAAEVSHAQARGRAIFELRTLGVDPDLYARRAPPALRTRQRITWDGSEESRARLHEGLAAAGLDPKDLFMLPTERPPYPGLTAFEREDAAVFFGRDAEITKLQAELRLCRAPNRPRLLVVQGASGSGKSSLVRAGLLPRLERDPHNWTLVPIFRPGGDRMRLLWEALTLAAGGTLQPSPDVVEPLKDEEREVWRNAWSSWILDAASAVRRHAGKVECTVLLVVDQLEEALGSDGDAFLIVLRDALARSGPELLALVTLRSDFSGALFRHAMLCEQPSGSKGGIGPELLEALTFQIPPMASGAIAEVVTKPAITVGLEIEQALVTQLVRDTGNEDALPLLAFTLRNLWDNHGKVDLKLTLPQYKVTGGLDDAVGKRAEEVLERLKLDEATLTSFRTTLLFRMILVLPDGRIVRRSLPWSETPNELRPLFDAFSDPDARLMVARDQVIEIAHEALFRTWPKLANWINDARPDLLLRRRAVEAGIAWCEGGRQEGSLWRSPDLNLLMEYDARNPGTLDELTKKFLDQCCEAANRQAEAERKARLRLRWLAGGALAAAIVAVSGAGWALAERERATSAAQIAEQARSIAERQREAAIARQQLSLQLFRTAEAYSTMNTVCLIRSGRLGKPIDDFEKIIMLISEEVSRILFEKNPRRDNNGCANLAQFSAEASHWASVPIEAAKCAADQQCVGSLRRLLEAMHISKVQIERFHSELEYYRRVRATERRTGKREVVSIMTIDENFRLLSSALP